MLSGNESKDELLATWAELLRSRDSYRSLGSVTFVARYTIDGSEWLEYEARSGDSELIRNLAALFLKDMDQRLAEVETALARLDISVSRPS